MQHVRDRALLAKPRARRRGTPRSRGPRGRRVLLALLLAGCSGGDEPASVAAPAFRPLLLELELNRERVRPGDAFLCSLSFENRGELKSARDLCVFLHVESPTRGCQEIAFQEDHEPRPPTRWWRPGERIDLGARVIEVPADLATGEYALHVGLYDPASEARVLDSTPLRLWVHDGAPRLETWQPEALEGDELAARRAALAERLTAPRTLQAENWRFSVDTQRAAFELEDRRSGVLWTSNPLRASLGFARLRRGDQRLVLPLDSLERVDSSEDRLRITFELAPPGCTERPRVELLAEAIEAGAGLRLSWRAHGEGEWRVESLTLLDQALATTDQEHGALVIPQWLGELAPAAGALPRRRQYRSHDISMQMAGVVKRGSALLVTWSDHEALLSSHAALHDAPRVAGRALRSLSLELSRADPALELYPLGPGDYVDIARAYRAVAERRGWRSTWARKRAADERVALLEGAAVFRVECLVRAAPGSRGDEDESFECLHSFDEVAACARHWREELGIDRALLLLGGWNRAGYDSGYPDILPANPECGGDEGLAACAARVHELGYLFGLHDNYQDIYTDSPSWDPELLSLDERGEPRAGGVWAGGQSWMVCGALQLELARRNLPRVAELIRPDLYFLDTTLTTRLQSCANPAHPLTALEDRERRLELFDYARETFGLLGLEGAREWAVPSAHLLEGVLTHRTVHAQGFTAVPIFPIVYGDCVNLLTLQSDRLDPWDAANFLDHLLYGEMAMYTVGPHLYWNSGDGVDELSEAQARDPRFTFARADRGWAQELGATDRLIKNTWEVLSYLHRAIGDTPMTDHHFLRADRSAESSSFGEVRVTVNYSDEPLETGQALLGRFGFLIESPRFVAFCALRCGGVDYPRGACFSLRSLDGEPLVDSRKIRVFHAFGDPAVRLPWGVVAVEREAVLER